jgi:hypothetical protein
MLDVMGLETEMAADLAVGDRVVMTASCAPVDERLRDSEDGCHLFDVEMARLEEEFKLLRQRCRLFVSSYASSSTTGEAMQLQQCSATFGT